MIDVRVTGDWGTASKTILHIPKVLRPTADKLLLQGAEHLRGMLIRGIDSQSPGGKPFRPLSKMTLAKRRLTNRGGDKALIQTADLRNAITVQKRRGLVFIGVPRKAKTARTRGEGGRFVAGRPLLDVARVHEFGARYTIKTTPRMRRFLAILAKSAGLPPSGGGGGGGTIVVTIPARPWLRPVIAQWRPVFLTRFQTELNAALFSGARQRQLDVPAEQLKLSFGGR